MTLQEEIAHNALLKKQRLEEEALQFAKEHPPLSSADLIEAVRVAVQEGKQDVIDNDTERKQQTETTRKQGKDIQSIQTTVSSIETSLSSIPALVEGVKDYAKGEIIALTGNFEEKLSQVANSIPKIAKQKDVTVKDIKGLDTVLQEIANTKSVSQPITTDIYVGGVIKKSGVSRINFISGATVTAVPNGVDIAVSGGGSSAWGSITGILSNQTDLQNALNALPNATNVQNITTSTTITLSDGNTAVFVNATSGAVNVTLPTPTANVGEYTIKRIDATANVITLVGTVNGVTNPTIEFQNDAWTIISNGTSYELI
jgi:archaellum component FlaC